MGKKRAADPTDDNDTIRADKSRQTTVHALGGDDLIFAGPGAGLFDGGDHTIGGPPDYRFWFGDTLSYRYAGKDSVSVSLLTGTAERGGIADIIQNIENVVGGVANDTIFGNNNRNVLSGAAGNDTIYGNGGDDILNGDFDKVRKGGNDLIFGGDGNDIIYAGPGRDTIDGGSNGDFAIYSKYYPIMGDLLSFDGQTTAGIFVDLVAGYAQIGNSLKARSTIIDIESVWGGSGADRVLGDDKANTLIGAGGNDVLEGRGGADELDGGEANDTLSGGAGDDKLLGGPGDDVIFGGDGNDLMEGGDGFNRLTGGAGSDSFGHYSRVRDFDFGEDFTNLITDFEPDVDQPLRLSESADSNGDGLLNAADDGISVKSYSLDGVQKSSLFVTETGVGFTSNEPVNGTWILFGVTEIPAL